MTQLSPFKKLQAKNAGYIAYKYMYELEPNKPHRIFGFESTFNEKCGHGMMVLFERAKKEKQKVHLSSKYMSSLTLPDDIDFFKQLIAKGEHPYLVFREKLSDGSFRIDIIESSPTIREQFKNWADVEELNTSDVSGKSIESSPDKTGNKPKRSTSENSENVSKKKKLN